MTGERILYIALILVAIGIGIYGSMNKLFRPHVYYECSSNSEGGSASFYVNEREFYVVSSAPPTYSTTKYDGEVEALATTTSYFKEDKVNYVVHNKTDNTFSVSGIYGETITASTYGPCQETRQFLQRN
ncbi:MAG: hypothetical protein CBE45_000440 [Thiotrichales bacterium TMED285]|jgi:hypothetical protein|nr:MAG: hypothetical protein CBE45_000440 [Thiotrichales bacterium TMED285]|tara:strand:- start:1927 stop:2313 length:387 start_codon:yes stop_codon:yes gene_type:complete